MQVEAMPFCASERAICSPLGPATVAPSTVQMVMRSARRRSGMANAVARACSVLQFQAIMTLVARVGGEVGEAIRIGRPLSNKRGFERDHGRALPFVARPRQDDDVEHAAVAADEVVAARRSGEPRP